MLVVGAVRLIKQPQVPAVLAAVVLVDLQRLLQQVEPQIQVAVAEEQKEFLLPSADQAVLVLLFLNILLLQLRSPFFMHQER